MLARTFRLRVPILATVAFVSSAPALFPQAQCTVASPTASLVVPHMKGEPPLSLDSGSVAWKNSSAASIVKDCSRTVDYPDLKTEVRGFWTDSYLYFLFTCPYRSLNLFLPAQSGPDRDKLWDRDVVEVFLGDDWTHIRRYREYEIAPTGDRVDLAIDLDKKGDDGMAWNSGWLTQARIDERAKVWYASARISLSSVSSSRVSVGTRWRMNLYRIDGNGPDSERRFLCWQPTCVVDRDPNHVPEAFGTLIFGK